MLALVTTCLLVRPVLAVGTYHQGLGAESQTIVAQRCEMPVPGTLLLIGAGLLAGVGVSRRKKA